MIYQFLENKNDNNIWVIWLGVCIYYTYLFLNPKAYEKRQAKFQRNQGILKKQFGRWRWLVQYGWMICMLVALFSFIQFKTGFTLVLFFISLAIALVWMLGIFAFCYNKRLDEKLEEKEE